MVKQAKLCDGKARARLDHREQRKARLSFDEEVLEKRIVGARKAYRGVFAGPLPSEYIQEYQYRVPPVFSFGSLYLIRGPRAALSIGQSQVGGQAPQCVFFG